MRPTGTATSSFYYNRVRGEDGGKRAPFPDETLHFDLSDGFPEKTFWSTNLNDFSMLNRRLSRKLRVQAFGFRSSLGSERTSSRFVWRSTATSWPRCTCPMSVSCRQKRISYFPLSDLSRPPSSTGRTAGR